MSKADIIECRIGAMKLTSGFLPYNDAKESDPETDATPYHLFVVEVRGNIASLFVGGERGHSGIVRAFSLRENDIKGGGFLYIDPAERLTLAGDSGSFGSIPKTLAKRFATLLVKILQERGIPTKGTKAEPVEEQQSEFWNRFTVA